VQEVAAVQGLAAIFIGRVDLTVSLGKTSLDDPVVIQSIDRIVRAARGRQIPVGMFLANPEEIPDWRSQGVGFFVLGSDHGFLQSGAKSLMQMFDR